MMKLRGSVALLGLSAVLGVQSLSAPGQEAPKAATDSTPAARTDSGVSIQVTGEVARALELSALEIAKLPRQSVEAKSHDGAVSKYDGVALIELLAKAGVPVGKDLRGKATALYLVVEAADEYRAVFALAELDPAFTDRVILLADRRDGKPLSAREGPFQIIVPGEKKHARWVRQVMKLRVGRA
jgi:DMSO/TMAO reductase YedYZ molybdopterin-dependent catalytic subunit